MTKNEFLLALGEKISVLPQDDVKERLHFYTEMIDDRMEEGLSEEEAVAAVGSVEEIAVQLIAEASCVKADEKKEPKKKRMGAMEIILLVLGSPIWLSLLIAAFAIGLALLVCSCAVIISLWTVFVAVAVCALCGVAAGIALAVCGSRAVGLALLGVGIVLSGLSIFLYYGCKLATKCLFHPVKRKKLTKGDKA